MHFQQIKSCFTELANSFVWEWGHCPLDLLLYLWIYFCFSLKCKVYYCNILHSWFFSASLSAASAGFCNACIVDEGKLLVVPSPAESTVDIIDVNTQAVVQSLKPDITKEKAGVCIISDTLILFDILSWCFETLKVFALSF